MKKMKSTIFSIVLFLLSSNFFINAQYNESQQTSLAQTSAERPLASSPTVPQPIAPSQSGANPALMALPLPIQTKSSDGVPASSSESQQPVITPPVATNQQVTQPQGAQPAPLPGAPAAVPNQAAINTAQTTGATGIASEPAAATTKAVTDHVATPQAAQAAVDSKVQPSEAQPSAANASLSPEQKTSEPSTPEGVSPEATPEQQTSAIPQEPVVEPSEPAKSEQQPESAATQQQSQEKQKTQKSYEEVEGIDTLEQEGGNWLLKRQALEKTMDVIEQIKDVFTKILESRVDYLVKRNKTDRSFDIFANKIGFQLGDLNQLLSALVTELKQERKEEGDLTEEEREVLTEVENKIADLKKLKNTLNSITDMDASLDDAIMRLEEEINTSNNYQNKAWKNFQTIKKVLSDEKADELYLQTQSLLKNMQDIYTYLKGDLLTYFNNVISNLKQAMAKVEGSIKILNEKGINLQDEVKKDRDEDRLAHDKRIETEAKKTEQEAEQKKEAPKKQQKSWVDNISFIWTYPLSLLEYIKSFFVTEKVEARPRSTTTS